MSNKTQSNSLPVTRGLTRAYTLTIVVMVGMGVLSLVGLILPDSVYPSEEFIRSFLVNDVINLLIGLPILLGSRWLTRRGNLIGLLFWPGALLYVLYNYTAYIFGLPINWMVLAYIALVLLSGITIFDLLFSIDRESVKEQLSGNVPVKISGWFLVLFGALFLFRAIGVITEASTNGTAVAVSEIGVLIADIVLSVLMIVGGALLLRRSPLGYTSGLGLLFAASMLFIGLVMILLLQPVLTDASFVLMDVLVVFIMGLICFIPCGLFTRGVVSSGKSS